MNSEKKPSIVKNSVWGLGNTHPAVLAIWAALVAVAHMLPSIPMIGTGGTFSVSSALIPLAGVFFGPIPGAICIAVGNFIGQIVAPHTAWMGLATFTVGTINAFASGLVSRGKWPGAVGIIGLGTILYYSTEIGRGAPFFPIIYYGSGVLLAIVGGIFAKKWLLGNVAMKFAGIFMSAYAGFVCAAALANMASIYLFQLPSDVWKVLTFVAPIERVIFALGASLVGIPLLIGLPKIGIYIGPQPKEDVNFAPPPPKKEAVAAPESDTKEN